jgi:hypothetical protein
VLARAIVLKAGQTVIGSHLRAGQTARAVAHRAPTGRAHRGQFRSRRLNESGVDLTRADASASGGSAPRACTHRLSRAQRLDP